MGFHSSSTDTWDAGPKVPSVQPYRPPLPPNPMPPSPQSRYQHAEPVLTTRRSIETLSFVPESRYTQQTTDRSHILFPKERMPGDPAHYFPDDIHFRRSRSDSRECYQIQYSHSSGNIADPSTPSPEESIFRSFSCDEDDQLPGHFSTTRGQHPFLLGMSEVESLTSDLSFSEDDSSPSMRVFADLLLPGGGIGVPLTAAGGAMVEDVMTRILDTAAKPLSSSSSSQLDPLPVEQLTHEEDRVDLNDSKGEGQEPQSVGTAQTVGAEQYSGDAEEGGMTSRSDP